MIRPVDAYATNSECIVRRSQDSCFASRSRRSVGSGPVCSRISSSTGESLIPDRGAHFGLDQRLSLVADDCMPRCLVSEAPLLGDLPGSVFELRWPSV